MAKATMKSKSKPKSKARTKTKNQEVAVLVGTRKGAFILRSDLRRKTWKLEGPLFSGKQIHHFISDHRIREKLCLRRRTMIGSVRIFNERKMAERRGWERRAECDMKKIRG